VNGECGRDHPGVTGGRAQRDLPSPTYGRTPQFHSRDFCTTLTQIFSIFRTAKIQLEWCPSRPKPQGITRCIELAHLGAANPLPPNHHEPHTIAHQRESAKEQVMAAWQARWHNADRRSRTYLALPSPPTGKPGGGWIPPHLRHPRPPHDKPCLHRRIHSPFSPSKIHQLSRMRGRPPNRLPRHPNTALALNDREPPTCARQRPTSHYRPSSALKGGKALLAFLEATKAYSKPREETTTRDEFPWALLSPPLLLSRNKNPTVLSPPHVKLACCTR